MSVVLSPLGGAGWQFFTNAGVVLAGGKLYTYQAGSTTPQSTWVDNQQAVQNANPIILNSAGRPPNEIWVLNNASYKFVLQDANNNVIGTWDNVLGINSSSAIQSEWVTSGFAPTFISGTQFSVTGNQTGVFTVNRRVQYILASGTFYGYVSASSFDGVNTTTVTIVPDSTNLDNTLSAVNYSFLNSTNPSVPQQFIFATNDKVPTRSGATKNQLLTNDGSGGPANWTASIVDNVVHFVNATDPTKILQFDLSQMTTGTTTTFTVVPGLTTPVPINVHPDYLLFPQGVV